MLGKILVPFPPLVYSGVNMGRPVKKCKNQSAKLPKPPAADAVLHWIPAPAFAGGDLARE